jgi:hypothetical protein
MWTQWKHAVAVEKSMKNVARQRYTTPETHGSATATRNGQSSLSLFFIGAACAGTSPFFSLFFLLLLFFY